LGVEDRRLRDVLKLRKVAAYPGDYRLARILNCVGAEGRVTQMADTNLIAATPVQKVVVVNGNTEVLGMLETVLDAGRYDMVFVESSDRAYSQIKKVVPNLVILCTRIEELDGFQLLTMLKLDQETKDIPILTYTTEYEGQDFDSAISQLADDDEDFLPTQRPALRMN
jgi:PleD family two-component response regulator